MAASIESEGCVFHSFLSDARTPGVTYDRCDLACEQRQSGHICAFSVQH